METEEKTLQEIERIEAIIEAVLAKQKEGQLACAPCLPMTSEEKEDRYKADALGSLAQIYSSLSQPWQLENAYIQRIRDAVKPILLELL